jgi:dethiobiotin synthetase
VPVFQASNSVLADSTPFNFAMPNSLPVSEYTDATFRKVRAVHAVNGSRKKTKRNRMSLYFITGIDTDVGKTFATGLISRYLLRQGKKVITQKLVQTGQDENLSGDILFHRQLMQVETFPEDIDGTTSPYRFSFPASPDLAAKLEGQTIEPAIITAATERLLARFDTVLLEGTGGFCVPLTPSRVIADYVAARQYPVILVTSGKLGSINHTLLTLEAIHRRNIRLAGIVFNDYPQVDEKIRRDSFGLFQQHCQKIVVLPRVDLNSIPDVDFSVMFPSCPCRTTLEVLSKQKQGMG